MRLNLLRPIKISFITFLFLPLFALASNCQNFPCTCSVKTPCTINLSADAVNDNIYLGNFAKNKTYICSYINLRCSNMDDIKKLSFYQLLPYPGNLSYHLLNIKNSLLINNGVAINTQGVQDIKDAALATSIENSSFTNCSVTINCLAR